MPKGREGPLTWLIGARATRQLEGRNKEEVLNTAVREVFRMNGYCNKEGDPKFYSHFLSSISSSKFNPGETGENLHFVSNLSNFQNFSYSKENFDPKFKSAANLDLALYNPVTSNYVREGAQNDQNNDLKWGGGGNPTIKIPTPT